MNLSFSSQAHHPKKQPAMSRIARSFFLSTLLTLTSASVGKTLSPSDDVKRRTVSGKIHFPPPKPLSESKTCAISEEEFSVLFIGNSVNRYVQVLSNAFEKESLIIERLVVRESKWDPLAVSPTGAKGLFQLTSPVLHDMVAPGNR